MNRLSTLLTSARTFWVPLAAAIVLSIAAFAAGSGADEQTSPGVGLPASAESARVAALQEELPNADTTTALLVYYHQDGSALAEDDLAVIDANRQGVASVASADAVPPATVSDDGTTAILVAPLPELSDVAAQADRADELRAEASHDLPSDLTVALTGPEGFAVDIASVFDGANFTLLLTTVLVVAVLLLITYRSPWLWLVPLAVVGLADGVSAIVATRVAAAFGITLDASVTGILSVLVFGAGTDYALLLIARYRDELRTTPDRRAAMARAWRGAAPAILASGGTVTLGLLTLVFAQLEGNRALGIACACGVVVAMLFALFVLPAALVMFGRWLFWPAVPRVGSEGATARGFWHRLGLGVSRRPVVVVIVGAVVLGGLALGNSTLSVGLSQSESLRSTPESVVGQDRLADAFPAGSGAPVIVMTDPAHVDDVLAAAEDVPGVASARPGEAADDVAEIDVVLDAEPETDAAFTTITELREQLHALDGADALVGGQDAQALDVQTAQRADQDLVIPLILALVLLVLALLLRSIVAPVLLLATVVASFFASLGLGWLISDLVFGFPAVDDSVGLFSFLFLVALGVDYNIFLVTRAREEALEHGTREGMLRALSSTGGVITSAGILLAAVFAVLGVLPLITLTQIGIIVCIGVLIDTLLVRTLVVPALAFALGDRFWWPSRRIRSAGPGTPTGASTLDRGSAH
jgi:RND superfamily putative drug exporter